MTRPRTVALWQVPARSFNPSGLGRSRACAGTRSTFKLKLAVVGKARDPLADELSQLLMPFPRDLPCNGAFQKHLDRFKSLLLGRADFDRDCKLSKMVVEGHGRASRLLPNVLGCRQASPALLPFLLPN